MSYNPDNTDIIKFDPSICPKCKRKMDLNFQFYTCSYCNRDDSEKFKMYNCYLRKIEDCDMYIHNSEYYDQDLQSFIYDVKITGSPLSALWSLHKNNPESFAVAVLFEFDLCLDAAKYGNTRISDFIKDSNGAKFKIPPVFYNIKDGLNEFEFSVVMRDKI